MNWNKEIEELETFFNEKELPESIKVKVGTITNVPKFIKSHLSFVKSNSGNKVYLPYLDNLKELKQLLTV